jgi:hypothetical protein
MYWPGKAMPWGEAHNVTGFTAPGLTWDLAEGRDGGEHGFHAYILLANPQTTAANVTVTFLREDGAPVIQGYVVEPTDDRYARSARAERRRVRRTGCGHERHADPGRTLDELECERHLLGRGFEQRRRPRPVS